MKIKVLFFAQIKEAMGEAERWMEVPEGSCVGDVAGQILPLRFAEGQDDGNSIPVIFAVNENFETREKILKESDCLAMMTPVSGG